MIVSSLRNSVRSPTPTLRRLANVRRRDGAFCRVVRWFHLKCIEFLSEDRIFRINLRRCLSRDFSMLFETISHPIAAIVR
jgi:hypothetical protein